MSFDPNKRTAFPRRTINDNSLTKQLPKEKVEVKKPEPVKVVKSRFFKNLYR